MEYTGIIRNFEATKSVSNCAWVFCDVCVCVFVCVCVCVVDARVWWCICVRMRASASRSQPASICAYVWVKERIRQKLCGEKKRKICAADDGRTFQYFNMIFGNVSRVSAKFHLCIRIRLNGANEFSHEYMLRFRDTYIVIYYIFIRYIRNGSVWLWAIIGMHACMCVCVCVSKRAMVCVCVCVSLPCVYHFIWPRS